MPTLGDLDTDWNPLWCQAELSWKHVPNLPDLWHFQGLHRTKVELGNREARLKNQGLVGHEMYFSARNGVYFLRVWGTGIEPISVS